MSKRVNKGPTFETWASATGMNAEEVKAAWEELRRRGLVSIKRGKVAVSPLAMRRAASDAERRLSAHFAGYLLTENSFIVRRASDPPGLPCILDTRITVEQIANYFKEGWGTTEVERDLNRSRELYEKHAPKRDTVPA